MREARCPGQLLDDLHRVQAALAVPHQHRAQPIVLVAPRDEPCQPFAVVVGAVRPFAGHRVADPRLRIAHADEEFPERLHGQVHGVDAAMQQDEARCRTRCQRHHVGGAQVLRVQRQDPVLQHMTDRDPAQYSEIPGLRYPGPRTRRRNRGTAGSDEAQRDDEQVSRHPGPHFHRRLLELGHQSGKWAPRPVISGSPRS